jgi:chemotaxis protein methyltransferase CheR
MELIKRVILPQIIASKNVSKKIRLWAPACSTGEEIYSLIILLEKVLPNMDGWEIDIVGSDINPNFIKQAKLAQYREWAFRGCSSEFKNTYFEKVGDSWRLIDRIRSRARFLIFDLASGTLPDFADCLFDFDFILCRNLFIYMNMDAISFITDKLSICLLPGGVLMTAHGELHAYRQSGLRIKIYPESLVYEKSDELAPLDPIRFPKPSISEAVGLSGEIVPLTQDHVAAVVSPKSTPELLELAWHLADRARFNEALDIYREIWSRDSMLPELYYLHAVISMEMGNIDRAKEDLRKTLYLDPHFISAYLELITIQIQEGKNSLAAKSCEQALKSLDLSLVDAALPGLRNSSVADIKQYLSNLQKSLTLQPE